MSKETKTKPTSKKEKPEASTPESLETGTSILESLLAIADAVPGGKEQAQPVRDHLSDFVNAILMALAEPTPAAAPAPDPEPEAYVAFPDPEPAPCEPEPTPEPTPEPAPITYGSLGDTVPDMLSKDAKDRLQAEYGQTTIRLRRLHRHMDHYLVVSHPLADLLSTREGLLQAQLANLRLLMAHYGIPEPSILPLPPDPNPDID